MSTYFENLVLKYLNGSLSENEFKELEKMLKIPDNSEYFQIQVKINRNLDHIYRPINTGSAFQKMKSSIRSWSVFSERSVNRIVKYAAIITVLLTTSLSIFLLIKYNGLVPNDLMVNSTSNIVLVKEDGSSENLKVPGITTISNSAGKEIADLEQDQLIYRADPDTNLSGFHKLRVPYGSRFDVVLSDGSRIRLNAGTTLNYPITFNKQNRREVFLDGEAYFNIEVDLKKPFVVRTAKMNIRVMGTSFNVSSYQNEDKSSTFLEKGALAIYRVAEDYKHGKTPILLPGQQAVVEQSNINIGQANSEEHLAWLSGILYFENESFENIIKDLERHYNVEIEVRSPALNEIRYTGIFTDESIDDVLKTFQKNTAINYLWESGQIIIESSK